MEAHSRSETPNGIVGLDSIYHGDIGRNTMAIGAEELLSRSSVYIHGMKVSELAAASKHPYSKLTRKGFGGVEVYVRLRNCGDDG